MKVKKGRLAGILIIEPDVYQDSRGFFFETYNKRDFEKHGICLEFVQDNHSRSAKGTVRGLHYQINARQDKLVRVALGEVFDVVVDIRRDSPTFGKWEGCLLSAENKKQLLVPKGFAHGFCVISEYAEFLYKCSDFYSPKDECGILWNDPDIGIEWPIKNPIISPKDLNNPLLKDINPADLL